MTKFVFHPLLYNGFLDNHKFTVGCVLRKCEPWGTGVGNPINSRLHSLDVKKSSCLSSTDGKWIKSFWKKCEFLLWNQILQIFKIWLFAGLIESWYQTYFHAIYLNGHIKQKSGVVVYMVFDPHGVLFPFVNILQHGWPLYNNLCTLTVSCMSILFFCERCLRAEILE